MPVCPPGGGCLTDPALFHVADAPETDDVAGIVSFSLSDCSSVVSRSGEYRFGCPGDALTSEDVGAPSGGAGVAGTLPVSVRFSSPEAVFVGSASEVRYLSADSAGGIAASTAAAGTWSVGSSLALTVGPAVGLLAALALGVVLGVRWINRIRSTV